MVKHNEGAAVPGNLPFHQDIAQGIGQGRKQSPADRLQLLIGQVKVWYQKVDTDDGERTQKEVRPLKARFQDHRFHNSGEYRIGKKG